MNVTVQLSGDARTVTIRIPLRVRKRGGRKLMAVPDAPAATSPKSTADRPILKALGRAYRWKGMLESGEFTSIRDLAAAEKINHSYVRRILRLTLLSPEITETILDGRLPRHVQLEGLLRQFEIEWAAQHDRFV